MASTYLDRVLEWPSTCELSGSHTLVFQLLGVGLLVTLVCFTAARFNVRLAAIRQPSDRQVSLRVGTPIKWCEGTHYAAVLFSAVSVVLFMISSMHGLGLHICRLGLNDEVAAFTRRLLKFCQAKNNAGLLSYLDTHAMAVDELGLAEALKSFLYNFGILLKLLYGCYACYIFAVTFQKVSNDFSLLTMFGYNDPQAQKIVHWHLGFTAVNFVFTLLLGFFSSWPPTSAWEIATVQSWSLPAAAIYRVTAATDLVLDCCVFWIPLCKLRKLQLPDSEKSILIGLFSSQGLAIILGGVRIFCLEGLFGEDLTYNGAGPLILSMVQLTVYVVSFSVPILRHLVHSIKSRLNSAPRPSEAPEVIAVDSSILSDGGHNNDATRARESGFSIWSQWSNDPNIDHAFRDEIGLPDYQSGSGSSVSIKDSAASEVYIV